MTDLAMWSLLVGFLSPPVLAVLQQNGFSTRTRALLASVFALVVAVVTVEFTPGGFSGRSLLSSFLVVFVGSVSFYKGFWRPTGLAPAIENATTLPAFAGPPNTAEGKVPVVPWASNDPVPPVPLTGTP